MAGYSKGIVATRKLNKNNKAKLGRGGDTKIREVGGRKSHVTALEAYLIDVKGKAGEDYAKRVGAGTVNPLTGMPEYYEPGILDYDELLALSGTDLSEQYAGWGLSDAAIEAMGPFGAEEELGFVGETQALALSGAETTRALTERGLEQTKKGLGFAQTAATRQAGIATAGITAGVAGTREALGRQLTAGSSSIGAGITQARAGAATAAAQSGFARSGTVTGALGQQMKSLTQDYGQLQADYSGGITAATRQADIGLAGVRAGEKTAAETYELGMEGVALDMDAAAADYEATTGAADLAYRKEVYGIKDIETEKFYGKMAEYGGESRDYVLMAEGGAAGIRRISAAGQKQIIHNLADGSKKWVNATDEEYDAAYAG